MTDIAIFVVSGGIGCAAYLLDGWRGTVIAAAVNCGMALAFGYDHF